MNGLKLLLEKTIAARFFVSLRPGRGNRKMKRAVERKPLAKTNLMIIAPSGNYPYRKNITNKATQPLIYEVMGEVDDTTLKITRKVFVSIVLQIKCSLCVYSKTEGINAILRDLCLRKELTLVDLYGHFFGKSVLIQRCPIHSSQKGKA